MHFSRQFTDHNSGRKHVSQTNDPIFFIYFFHSTCLQHLFLYLKMVKIHFHVVPPFGPLWYLKYLNLGQSYRFAEPIILFQKVHTLRLLKIHIMFCPPRGARKRYQLKDYIYSNVMQVLGSYFSYNEEKRFSKIPTYSSSPGHLFNLGTCF